MKLSEATLTWEHWRRRRRFRRTLLSWGLSLTLAASVGAGLALGGLLQRINVGEKGESIAVKLGNPDGEDLPLKVSATPDASMQAVMMAQRELAKTTIEETRQSVTETEPAATPVPAPAPAKSKSPPQPATTPAAPAPNTPKVPDKPVVSEKVIRGSEKGNASELILKPQGEKISQNGWSPVYLYMPLPARLDASVLQKIRGNDLFSVDDLRALLLAAYSRVGDTLTLTTDPGLDGRPGIWLILDGAGYDIANADYKKAGLKPVVLTFSLDVPTDSSVSPRAKDVKLEQSSGNAAVDTAVVYAFGKSTFANGTGQIAQGRYTYDFTGKR